MKIATSFIFMFFLCRPIWAGEIIGWGSDAGGQITGGPFSGSETGLVETAGQTVTHAIQIAAQSACGIALNENGTLTSWGFDNSITGFSSLTNVSAIIAGPSSSLALKNDGTVFGAGYNPDGQVTGIPDHHAPFFTSGLVIINGQILSNIVAIAVGDGHSLAVKKDTTVISWGRSGRVPFGLSNVVAIAAARSWVGHDLALKADGTVVEWGPHDSENEIVHKEFGNVIAIASGSSSCLALKMDGTVIAWGSNDHGEINVPIGLNHVIAIAAGDFHSLALKYDGTVVAWGDNRWHQTDVPEGLTNIVAIAAGADFSLAITTNNDVARRFLNK